MIERPWMRVSAMLLALWGSSSAIAAETVVHTNEAEVNEVSGQPSFAIEDKKAVFRLVFGSLANQVTVYPTENYYYFWFYHRGIKYAGNFRLDIDNRDKGFVHFNYFKDFTHWQRDESDFSAVLGAKDGVTVAKAGPLAYDISFEGRTVRFNLNDLSKVKPPEGTIAKGETYIGPIFDESGMRFFLVFNEELKTFLYIMDETVPPADQFNASASADRISIGIRTGFAYYDDRFAKRKILVGVNVLNTSINNYLDGPFDQLPDNFIEGRTLERAILAQSPAMEGQMDRFGNSPDGQTRYLIAPYLLYEQEDELSVISECAASEEPPVYYNCFNFEGAGGEGGEGGEDDGAEPPPEEPQQ